MNPIDKLSSLFSDFPGIGARQAKRFAYFLLTKDDRYLNELTESMKNMRENITQCDNCCRYYSSINGTRICNLCADTQKTDATLLLVVEKDTDFEKIHKSGSYTGKYFILGGTVPVLEKNPEEKIRFSKLKQQIENRIHDGLSEVILALSATPQGDHTGDYLVSELADIAHKNSIKISLLGRGLSTGTEIEYSDNATIKSALERRTFERT